MRKIEHAFEVSAEWVHVQFSEASLFTEVYGFSGSQGMINLEGVRLLPRGRSSKTLLVFMHPATSTQFLPMPRALAQHGFHVLCAGNRYLRNDTPLIMEKVAVDLGAYLRHARQVWGYERIVLCGWSGGGPLALFYQSQAQQPTVTTTAAGEPYDLKSAGLIPANAIIFQAANVSRATLLAEWLDPSIIDEHDPDRRSPELDIYDPRNPNQPPYSSDYIAHYRAAQLARMRRRTDWVKDTLARLKRKGGKEIERGFINHRTMADLRFLDPAVDPNDRKPRSCHLGDPETSNSGPAGLGRYSTLRSWLSQWSIDDSHVRGADAAATIKVPLAVIVNSADDAAPAADSPAIFKAAGSKDKKLIAIKGATHYYQGQPGHLQQAIAFYDEWLGQRGFYN